MNIDRVVIYIAIAVWLTVGVLAGLVRRHDAQLVAPTINVITYKRAPKRHLSKQSRFSHIRTAHYSPCA